MFPVGTGPTPPAMTLSAYVETASVAFVAGRGTMTLP
jgi:hypothetical protein